MSDDVFTPSEQLFRYITASSARQHERNNESLMEVR